MTKRAAAIISAALIVSGCGVTTGQKRPVAPLTTEAECRLFNQPPHVITAQRRSGKRWVSQTIEVGKRACGWDDPAPAPGDRNGQ